MRSLWVCSLLMAGFWTLGALVAMLHLPSCGMICVIMALPWWVLTMIAGRDARVLRH
jgi:hypothetical protein